MRGCRGRFLLFIYCILFVCPILSATTPRPKVIKIGVLANRGITQCIKNWQPTAKYLTNKMQDYKFEIIPLSFKEVETSVKNNKIDFIITNSHIYVLLQTYYAASRILTVEKNIQGQKLSQFGGVLFCRADRQDILSFENISQKKLAAVQKDSLGGWLSQCRELVKLRIDPETFFSSINFTNSHNKVITEVLNSSADIGMVRTGIIEQMVSEGKFPMSKLRIIMLTSAVDKKFPLKTSTRLYPGWPLAKLKNTSRILSNQIATNLLNMSLQANKNNNTKSKMCWTFPESYAPVKDCLKELELAPFDNERQKAMRAIIKSDPLPILIFICFLLVIIIHHVKTNRFNKQLLLSNKCLEEEITDKIQAQDKLKRRLDTDNSISNLMEQLTQGTTKAETMASNMLRVAINATKSTSGFVYLIENKKNTVLCGIIDGRAIIDKNDLQKLLNGNFDIFIRKIMEPEASKCVAISDVSELATEYCCNQLNICCSSILAAPLLGAEKDILGYIIVANAPKYGELSIYSMERFSFLLCQSLKETKQKSEKKEIEAKLQRVQKLEALGNLASGISHDFKNILLPIIGFSEMILEDADKNSSIYTSAISILESAKRAKELTSQILSISRVNTKSLETICIQNVLDDLLAFIRASIPHTISIDKAYPQEQVFIDANSGQLHQAITNLCINASHAMEKNGGKLSINVSTTNEVPDKEILYYENYVCISISDTGVGIEEEIIEKIFDPYFTTKKKEKGTGLGLAMVQGIIESFGGHIGVVSKINIGTTFLIYIPISKEINTQLPTNNSVDDLLLNIDQKHHILLVDDDITILELTKKVLKRVGFETTAFSDSTKALCFFKMENEKIDLVISDMTMPNITGDVLAKKMYDICPDIPFILSTGASADEISHLPNKPEITGLLPKPFLKKDLIKILCKALKQKTS